MLTKEEHGHFKAFKLAPENVSHCLGQMGQLITLCYREFPRLEISAHKRWER